MKSRYKIIDAEQLCFVTSTIQKWIPVFTNEKYFEILIDSFRYCRKVKGLKIYAYVILDNHFHTILSADNLSRILASIKGFTARTIIDQLKAEKRDWLLNQLRYYKLKHKAESEYQLWQEGFHPQIIYSEKVFRQKADYIHFNPVKRGLVTQPEYWRYSSAASYILGAKGELEIDSLE
jgi:REP element-mobilizing transposase RayT